MISVEVDGRGVATLLLDRAEKHNALSGEMCDALREAAAELGADPSVRVVVLTGAGKSFCAGGDLAWMRAQFAADRAGRMAEARRLAFMLRDLNEMPKPLVARVNGTAMGGGLGLMCVADVAVAADAGRFGFTETRLGLIPATISPYVLARMGEARARRVFMSARVFGAEELVGLGLVASVVEPGALDAAVEAEVVPYLEAAPGAVAAAKALARRLGPVIDEAVIEESVVRLADTWETVEAQAGVAAFFKG
ncbi:MAG: crotonase/enoyl-CoA hydratase family protein [Pseudomonadota bacterium]